MNIVSHKVIGASLLGLLLVVGAYLLNELNVQRQPISQTATVTHNPNTRSSIAVFDNDGNGIEDWRDEFVEIEPITLTSTTTPIYEPPTTLTGQLGVSVIEGYLRNKTLGALGKSQADLVSDTVDTLVNEAGHNLYDVIHISPLHDWEPEDMRTYANAIALIITNHNIADSEGELYILQDILENERTERLTELQAIANAYRDMRDAMLDTPVPDTLTKEHLDLINTYHALYKDIEAMTLAIEDPTVSLLHIKRYQDDATGLSYALTNMYQALLPISDLIEPTDPALLFVTFSPDFTHSL